MFGRSHDVADAQKKFFEDFESQYGKKVEKVEFAQLKADNNAFRLLNLTPYLGENTLSGLLVFCTKALYFHSFPHEGYMGIVKKELYENPDNVSQCICISDLKDIKAEFPKQSKFSFLFPEQSHNISFSAQGPSSTIYFTLEFLKKAEAVYEEIKKTLNS